VDTVALGIFVGGGSTRMGRPKGLLEAPAGGETLLERLVRLGRSAGLEPLIVGRAEAYERVAPEVPRIPDDPPGVGPIGGLRALLRARPVAVVVACDMPAVDRALLERLRDAEGVVAPWTDRWEPLCARYEASVMRPAIEEALGAGEHSLQRLLDRVGARPIEVAPGRLVDWDTPADVSDARREE
jgi:molybdopterin-guanine dinucleotide biosynthesis protein A